MRQPELSHEMTRLSGGGGRRDHPSGGKAGAHVVRRISGRPPDAVIHTCHHRRATGVIGSTRGEWPCRRRFVG